MQFLTRYASHLYPLILEYGSCQQSWVRIRIDPSNPDLAYTTWRRLYALCEHTPNLYPVLEPVGVADDVPARGLDRWQAEHVAAVVVDGSAPTPSWFETLLSDLFDHDIRMIIGVAESEDDLPRLDRMCQWAHGRWAARPAPTDAEIFTSAYRDVLQVPLQPLGDHLLSQTYEVISLSLSIERAHQRLFQIFEKDPVKYERYEEAVYLALTERRRDDDDAVVVMVVGAGRGPLVHCVLSASDRAARPVRLFALEKNPNACITLRHLTDAIWGKRVRL
jgi:protein arginine N-methyltransferase 5